jgi:hypothetical protein
MATGKVRESTVSTKQSNNHFTAAARNVHMQKFPYQKFPYSGKATFAKAVTPDNPYPVDLLKYAISRR